MNIRKIQDEITDVQKRLNDLNELVEKEDRGMTPEERKTFDADFATFEQLQKDLERAEKADKVRSFAASTKEPIVKEPSKEGKTLEQRAKQDFDIVSFLRDAKNGTLTGLNAELHQEAVKEARTLGTEVKNFGIPSFAINRDMTAGTDTAGGHAIAEEKMGIIEYLENRLVVRSLGADYMTGLVGDLSFPRENNSLVATWKGENATLDELNPTMNEVTLSPKRLGAYVDVSNQLVQQTSPSISNRISRRLGGALARAIDNAAIQGSGSAPVPRGILNTSGIGDVAMGTNGGNIDWAAIVELVKELEIDNADLGNLAYLTNPQVKANLQTIEKATNTAQFLLQTADSPLNGYTLGVSNHVPSDLDKGTSTGVCSAMIFGNFNDLMIGQWGGLDVMVNPYTKAKEGLIEVIAAAYIDVAVARPQSFAAIQDITIA